MKASLKMEQLRIGGMTCVNCQNSIEKKLRNTPGIRKVKVSYNAGTAAITYDEAAISHKAICGIIKKLDYEVLMENQQNTTDTSRVIGLLLIIVSLYFLLEQFGILNMLAPGQLVEVGMGYGMLFVIGLVTSVHCVAMCGGINLTQCIPQTERVEGESRFLALRPAFLYNFGRVISYTAVGFVVGGIGSAITFSNTAQGILKLIAGVFMVIMGINMLDIFPWLRKLNPRMPMFIAGKVNGVKAKNSSPLIVGLLNGFMPCGPLQAMQIYALSTGNPFTGALSMFLFSLGTVPLMFGLGALSSILSKTFTKKIMTAGAVLVVVLGLSMFTQGYSLTGFSNVPAAGNSASVSDGAGGSISIEDGVQVINSTLSPRNYPAITVMAGVPVKWTIDAPQGSINGCNNRMFIKAFGVEHQFKTGENIIEFTPTEAGTFQYSCWMGMIRSTITVAEATD